MSCSRGGCGCGGGENISADRASTCSSAGCGCGHSLRHGVGPYYQDANMCPEDNTKTVYVQSISQVYRSADVFIVPACGKNVFVRFDGVVDAAIGAWIWNESYGFLEIVGFNVTTSELELQNPCPQLNCGTQAAPGTQIPSCTTFVVTVPPCLTGASTDSIYPFLASGFVAPANGVCINIAVTNTNGLWVGREVAIKGGTYRISAILSSTLITICNDGLGIVAGTVVDYKDLSGNLNVPITAIESSPCLATPVNTGTVLVCDGSIQKPLVGTQNGQILVYDKPAGTSYFKTLNIPTLNCAELTADFTLDPVNPPGTTYLVTVTSTASFQAGDLVSIGVTTFTVDTIVNPTQMRVVPLVNPVAIDTYHTGSQLCTSDCCTVLQDQLDNQAQVITEGTQDHGLVSPTLTAVGQTVNSAANSITITNPSATKTMLVQYGLDTYFVFALTGTAGRMVRLESQLNFAEDANPAAAMGNLFSDEDTYQKFPAGVAQYHSKHQTRVGTASIAPGASVTIQIQALLKYVEGTLETVNVQTVNSHVSALAIAMV